MSWPSGKDDIRRLLQADHLQKVTPAADSATELLLAAQRHLTSAIALSEDDPDSAYTLLYDAARKSLAAVLLAQGLRATRRGGHYALEEAIRAQFTEPPPRDAFRSFGRLRRTRNQVEYENISSVTIDDVRADAATVGEIHAVATKLVPILPVFAD